MAQHLPAGELVRACVCGQPLHPGSVMSSETEKEGPYTAIVIAVGPMTAEPMHRLVTLASMTRGRFVQHIGDLLQWQLEVGEPIRCSGPADIPPPCPYEAPGCQDERQRRLVWQATHAPD